ncbi:hypothetical protein LZ30DRAFT_636465 [Colletotrichum cereale]|nr:hypothetical protein LZ30DRAFT_636465 [Colletotrichum cereale]
MVSFIIALTYLLVGVTFAWPTDLLGLEKSSTASLVTRRDAITSRYTAVRDAAAAAGRTLRNGEWHYLRLCTPLSGPPQNRIQRETGCEHHFLVVGKVIKKGVFTQRKDFEGRIYHVRYADDTRSWFWTTHEYHAWEHQWIYYGGPTTSRKASRDRLDTLSTTWVNHYGSCWDLGEGNCLGYYKYIASNL